MSPLLRCGSYKQKPHQLHWKSRHWWTVMKLYQQYIFIEFGYQLLLFSLFITNRHIFLRKQQPHEALHTQWLTLSKCRSMVGYMMWMRGWCRQQSCMLYLYKLKGFSIKSTVLMLLCQIKRQSCSAEEKQENYLQFNEVSVSRWSYDTAETKLLPVAAIKSFLQFHWYWAAMHILFANYI